MTFLWRGNDSPSPNGESALAANYGNSYYVNAVAWADTNGMLSKVEFDPSEKCPRADIVHYIYLSNNSREQINVVSSTESHALSEYREIQYNSLISDNSQYLGQRIKVIGTVGGVIASVNDPYLYIHEKGDYQLNYHAKYDLSVLPDVVEYKREDDIEVYGVVCGMESYGGAMIPAILIEQIRPLSISGGTKINHEYGPFTIYQYSSDSSSNKLYAQSDITSFQVTRIGFSGFDKNRYRVDCQFAGKCTKGYCKIVIQFLDKSGKAIGETTVSESVTEGENFSVTKSIYIDTELIEQSDSIRFVSSTGDLANTPRKETPTSSNSSTGSSSSGSGSSSKGSSSSNSQSDSGSTQSRSSSTQTEPKTPIYDDDPFCPTCDGLGECPKCFGARGFDCTCLGGKCTKCAGMGYISSRYGDKICSACHGSKDCPKCGGEGWIECSRCHGDGLCPTCHNVNNGLKPGRTL